jgi:hypothetical protein
MSVLASLAVRRRLQYRLSPLTQLSGFFFCFCGPRQVVDRRFQGGVFGRGRCDRRDKSGGPPQLKLSLKVKRNSAHGQSCVFVVAPSHGLSAVGRLKVRLGLTSGQDRAAGIEGAEHAGILNRRSQPGRNPLHRFGLSDHLIDVIAIDALKTAQLESDAGGLDTRQDHWSHTFGPGVGLNRDAA